MLNSDDYFASGLHILLFFQINGQAFALGVKLLEKISGRSRQLVRGWRGVVSQDIMVLTVQIVSNLLQAATHSSLMLEVENIDQKRFQWTQRSVDVIHEMLTVSSPSVIKKSQNRAVKVDGD